MVITCPNIQAHHNETVLCLKFGHLKIMNFPFGTNGKLMILGAPILKHFRVFCCKIVRSFAMQKLLTLFRQKNGDFFMYITSQYFKSH